MGGVFGAEPDEDPQHDHLTLLWVKHVQQLFDSGGAFAGQQALFGPVVVGDERALGEGGHFPLVPTRTALIDVDMQDCFVEGSPLSSPDGLVVLQRINQLAEACRKVGILVVHTRGWMRPDGSNLGVMGELVPPFIVALYTEGSPTAELHRSLVVASTDVVLNKPRYGAFHGTDLEAVLRSCGIDTVIISGIATNICCETTAREAAQRDFRVLFLSDGTATKDMLGVAAADLQRATCASLGMVFAQVLTVDEVTEKIRHGASNTGEPELGGPARSADPAVAAAGAG